MFSAKALRCAANTPKVTRHATRTIASVQNDMLQNAPSTGIIEEHGTRNEPVSTSSEAVNTVSSNEGDGTTPALSFIRKVSASKGTLAQKPHQPSIRLQSIHHNKRRLKNMMRGPYGVRLEVASPYEHEPRTVQVQNNKVVVGLKPVPNIWLRDNCQCASCMHDATKQRLLDTFSIPKDIAIESHAFEGPENETLRLEWSDGHISHYSVPLLAGTITRPRYKSIQRQGLTEPHLWDSSIASSAPQTTYDVVISRGTADLLRNLRTHGFCYVDETDATTPEATEKLLKQIAFIRETHYGGFYDFTADLASKDTAYTNIALEAHTDTTYFSDPAGLQAFHLLSHTEGSGGASLLVDGFNVAKKLLQTDRKAYKTLSTVNVHAHASGNEGISIQPYRGFPVLEHDPDTGDLLRVRWNSSDRASIELPIEEVENWYDAARKFNALLKKKKNEYWEQLTPGRVLIFDNWRVLHGRSAFTGKRRICGGYINRDDWISQYKMHTFGQDKVLSGLAVN